MNNQFKNIILSLGSNISPRRKNLERAVTLLKKHFQIIKVSHIYETAPLLKYDNQANFLNAALLIRSSLSCLEVLKITQGIEEEMGRIRLKRWGERNIDIDIIDYNNEIIEEANLTVPHKEMAFRSFVLLPMQDILESREYIHPKTKKSLEEMIKSIDNDLGIKQLEDKLK